MDGEVNVAVGSDATELLGDVVDDWEATVVEVGLTKLPRLSVADHVVQLVNSSDESELGVFKNFSISGEFMSASPWL